MNVEAGGISLVPIRRKRKRFQCLQCGFVVVQRGKHLITWHDYFYRIFNDNDSPEARQAYEENFVEVAQDTPLTLQAGGGGGYNYSKL